MSRRDVLRLKEKKKRRRQAMTRNARAREKQRRLRSSRELAARNKKRWQAEQKKKASERARRNRQREVQRAQTERAVNSSMRAVGALGAAIESDPVLNKVFLFVGGAAIGTTLLVTTGMGNPTSHAVLSGGGNMGNFVSILFSGKMLSSYESQTVNDRGGDVMDVLFGPGGSQSLGTAFMNGMGAGFSGAVGYGYGSVNGAVGRWRIDESDGIPNKHEELDLLGIGTGDFHQVRSRTVLRLAIARISFESGTAFGNVITITNRNTSAGKPAEESDWGGGDGEPAIAGLEFSGTFAIQPFYGGLISPYVGVSGIQFNALGNYIEPEEHNGVAMVFGNTFNFLGLWGGFSPKWRSSMFLDVEGVVAQSGPRVRAMVGFQSIMPFFTTSESSETDPDEGARGDR